MARGKRDALRRLVRNVSCCLSQWNWRGPATITVYDSTALGICKRARGIFERGFVKWRWCGVSVVGTLDRSDDGKRVVSPLWERRGSSIPIESREDQSKGMKKLCQLGLSAVTVP